jgi:uncharacterized protein YkwD
MFFRNPNTPAALRGYEEQLGLHVTWRESEKHREAGMANAWTGIGGLTTPLH